MKQFVRRLELTRKAIGNADYILIGGGAGLSDSAGLKYSGDRFTDNFKDFIEKYGMKDMYSSGFYPFKTEEEKWAYWARHIYVNRYEPGPTKLYQELFDLVNDKEYFVLTTNVESQFYKSGFDENKIFATQGDYGLFQCSEPCHDKLYDNESQVMEMLKETEDCRIPTELIPKCPVCGKDMEINIRKDNKFVEDENWHKSNDNYQKFLEEIDGEKVVFLELGVGYNTPTIIRFPFEQLTYNNPNALLIRINMDFPNPIKENIDKTISFDEDISEIINNL